MSYSASQEYSLLAREMAHTAEEFLGGRMDVGKVKGAINEIFESLSIEQLLKFRDRMKVVHAEQLAAINATLAKKGHVEPHLVNVQEHNSE